jgi:hypothetical protein
MKPDIDALRTQVIDAARDVVSEWRRMGQEDEVAERERILGEAGRQETERLAACAARRSRGLGMAYSLSIAASYLIFVAGSLLKA